MTEQWRDPTPAEIADMKHTIRLQQRPADTPPEEGDLRLHGPGEDMQVYHNGAWEPYRFQDGPTFLSGEDDHDHQTDNR